MTLRLFSGWLIALSQMVSAASADFYWDGVRAPAEVDGGRVTRSADRSIEAVARSVADNWTGYDYHNWWYHTENCLWGLCLLGFALEERRYIDYIDRGIELYGGELYSYQEARARVEREPGDFAPATEADMRRLSVCPSCCRAGGEFSQPGELVRPPAVRVRRDGTRLVLDPRQNVKAGAITIAEMYLRTGKKKYLDLLDIESLKKRSLATQSEPDGRTTYPRLLIDSSPWAGALARLGKISGDPRFYDRAIDLLFRMKRLWIPELNLFHQGWGWGMFKWDHSPEAWSRGSGWWLYGAVETLTLVPPDFPRRDELLQLFRLNIDGLLAYQDSGGMWHNIITRWDSFPETSGTGLILFAIARGIRIGVLDDKYLDRLFLGLAGLKHYIDTDGIVRNCCYGTGAQDAPHDYYARPHPPADTHAPFPVMMLGAELIQLEKRQ